MSYTEPVTHADRIIGSNVARHRQREGVTQQAVAALMRQRGHKWSQATVWAVEKGERPLRLAEAEDLSEALGTEPWVLARPERERALEAALRADEEALTSIQSAAFGFSAARCDLLRLLEDASSSDGEQIAESSKLKVLAQLAKTPEGALETGIERWKGSTMVVWMPTSLPRWADWPSLQRYGKALDVEHHEEA